MDARYRIRTPTMDDVAAATALVRRLEEIDYGEPEVTQEDIQIGWQQADLGRDVWLVENEKGELVAAAAVRARGQTLVRTRVGVLPEHLGRGIGTELLQRVEARGRELAAQAPDQEIKLSQSAGGRDDAARVFLETHGYAWVRRFWEMGIDLDEEPAAPDWPPGITVESLQPGEERAVFDAMEEAFLDHWGFEPHDYAQWRAGMVDRDGFDPSLWLIARDGGEIAGASLNYLRQGKGLVGVLGVRRPWRRRGLGRALLLESFREFRRRGVRFAYLGVDSENQTGATRLYEQAGMRVLHHTDSYEKTLRA